jgi:tetratricopeptide (TPR) repeat protein
VNEITLSQAVNEINRACEIKDIQRPFFFIAGAGISCPIVPLASEIQAQCRKKALEADDSIQDPSGKSALHAYSYWMKKAYPQLKERRSYFKELIYQRRISPANLRLANLLAEKKLASLVVTSNFDDFLSRALALFGHSHIVCDHPAAAFRIDAEADDIQILQVHGSYWFYDTCNLEEDIATRAQDSPNLAESTLLKLSQILSRRSPIVIGYSGWEEDVIMTAVRRRLLARLGTRLYWFCFSRSSADSLPAFLTKHDDVFVVLPEPEKASETSPAVSGSRSLPAGNEPEERPTAGSSISAPRLLSLGNRPKARLDADYVLRQLVTTTPHLTNDPVGFLAKQLEDSFPPSKDDIYALDVAIDSVKEASRLLQEKLGPMGKEIEKVTDAFRRSAYSEAIKYATAITSTIRIARYRERLMKLSLDAARGLNDDSDVELSGYELVKQWANQDDSLSPQAQVVLATALRAKGHVLANRNCYLEALTPCEEVVKRFGDFSEPDLQEQVARALNIRGVAFWKLGRKDESFLAFDEILSRFGDSPEPALREVVAKALVNKGISLAELKEWNDAIQACDKVLGHFSEASELVLRLEVARALGLKGSVLAQSERSEKATQAYSEVLRRFKDAPEPALREEVATTFVKQGVALAELGRRKQAVEAYDEALKLFGTATEASLQVQVALALVNKADVLRELGEHKESLQASDAVLSRFRNVPDPAMREQVASALYGRGLTLSRLNDVDKEIQAYDELTSLFGNASEPPLCEWVAMAFVAKGVALGKMHAKKAIQAYDEVLRRFDNATEPMLREMVARAIFGKGFVIKERRPDEAKHAFQEVLSRFGNSSEASLQRTLQGAKFWLGQRTNDPLREGLHIQQKPKTKTRKLKAEKRKTEKTHSLLKAAQSKKTSKHS